MKEKIPNYLYDTRQLLSIGLFCASVIGFSLASLFIYDNLRGRYHVEPFLTFTELLICLALCLIAYVSASQLTKYLRQGLQRLIPDWISVSAFGSLFFAVGMATFLYIDTLIDLRNYKEFSFGISGTPPRPTLPTAEDLVIYALAFGVTAFVGTSVLYKVFRQLRD